MHNTRVTNFHADKPPSATVECGTVKAFKPLTDCGGSKLPTWCMTSNSAMRATASP